MSETAVLVKEPSEVREISMDAIYDCAVDSCDEITEFLHRRAKSRQHNASEDLRDVRLERFAGLIKMLEDEFHFGDPVKFPELLAVRHYRFWQEVLSCWHIRERPELSREEPWGPFELIYRHIRTCVERPFECGEAEMRAVLAWCGGVYAASNKFSPMLE